MIRIRDAVTAIAGVLSCITLVTAQDRPITDVEKAGIDFKIQGEYEGQVPGGNKWGAHIIALGEDTTGKDTGKDTTGTAKFKSIGYRGGLPGNGWDGEPGQYHVGELRDDSAVIPADDFVLKVDGETLAVSRVDGEQIVQLNKQHRKSPTLGQAPPENAIVLFDGTSLDQWERAELIEGKYLGATNCFTKKKFDDHQLHLEFRTPFMPQARGQARGNSGVYIQSRYELQVLDSFGLEGKDNECGGIYKISAPRLNMCYPPLSWQTYDIDFVAAKYNEENEKVRNARVTIRHNGVIIHDNLELPHETPGRYDEGPEPRGLFLQDHGNPVVYRNIWAIEKE